METFIKTTDEITELVNGFEQKQTILRALSNTRIKSEIRDTIPFSTRLNAWIREWFENHHHMFVFTDEDDFDENDVEATLQHHIKRYKETGKIHIWRGASENTIFASEQVNHYFRAWHDYIHITENLSYDFLGETMVASIQMAQLPDTYVFEKQLIYSEVVGQAMYFMKYNRFVERQRGFTIMFLKDGRV